MDNEMIKTGAEAVMENADDIFAKVLKKAKKSSGAVGAGIGLGVGLAWCYLVKPAIDRVRARKNSEDEADLTVVDEASEE